MGDQPEALRLADRLQCNVSRGPGLDGAIDAAIAAEFSDAATDAAMGKI
jgi:hypothetical protein